MRGFYLPACEASCSDSGSPALFTDERFFDWGSFAGHGVNGTVKVGELAMRCTDVEDRGSQSLVACRNYACRPLSAL